MASYQGHYGHREPGLQSAIIETNILLLTGAWTIEYYVRYNVHHIIDTNGQCQQDVHLGHNIELYGLNVNRIINRSFSVFLKGGYSIR